MMTSFTDRARERGIALSFTERKRNRIAEDKAEANKRAKTLTNLSQGYKAPIDLLPPQQRDQAEQARRAKTLTNLSQEPLYKPLINAQPQQSSPIINKFDSDKIGGYIANKAILGLSSATEGFKTSQDMLKPQNQVSILGDIEKQRRQDLTGRLYQERADLEQAGQDKSGFVRTIGNLTEGATGMIPTMALGAMSGGVMGVPFIMGQAGGNSYTQARQEGATHEQALKYGLASGATEGVIEGIIGGIPGMKGIADPLVDMATRGIKSNLLRGAARVGLDAAGEGIEEVLSTAINPYLQRATYNPEAKNASAQELAGSFGMGAALSGILGGGQSLINARLNRPTLQQAPIQQQTQQAPIQSIQQTQQPIQTEQTVQQAPTAEPLGGKAGTQQGEKLLSFPQTMESSDATAPELKQMIKDNPLSYEPINNVDTLKYAQQIVDQNFDAAKRIVMEGESFSNATESAMAQDVIRRLQNEKKWDDAFDVMEATARKAKTSGQTIQAFAMWRRMTPEGMLKYADKVFRESGTKMTGEFANKLTDSMKRIEGITDPRALQRQIMGKAGQMPEWAYQSMSQKTAEQLQDIARAQVLMDISNEIPKSGWKKASTIQAMSHLINIKTAARNILGNLSFSAAEKLANTVAVPIDIIASKFTGKRSLTTPQFKDTFKAGFKQAKESAFDAALGIDRTGTSKGKYNVPIGGAFKTGNYSTDGQTGLARLWTNAKNAGNKVGSAGEKVLKYELNVPDEFFKGQVYSDVLQQQMKAAGVSEPTADMIDYANARAKYTTFQDDSLPAKILQGLKDVLNLVGGGEFKKGKSGIKTHEFGLGDFLVKYTTVPGNLISRSLEYTPVGMAKILTTANNAKLSAPTKQAEIAMTIGRSITGTALIGFAALLNRMGLLISEDKDRGKNAQALDQAEGLGNYKVNVTALERMLNGEDAKPQAGDLLQSYNWIEPLGVLLAIGAEVDKQISDKDKSVPAALFAIGNAAMEEVLDLPTLSVIRQMTYQDNAFDVLMTPLVQGVSGFVPAPVRQFAQYQDPISRLTKSDSQGGAIFNRIKSTMPSFGGIGGRQGLEPKINAWGQEVTYPGGVFNTFINPGQTSTYQPSEVTPQLKQLEEITGKTDFYPRFTAPYSFTHKKQPIILTPEEKTLYMRLEGEEVHRRFKEILANGVTESTAEETIKELNKAKDKASSMARDEILKGRGLK